jgi:hypothetical protein
MINTKKYSLLLLASITTGTSVSMVVSNAITHGVGPTYQTILSIFALAICLGTHLLPAWSKYLTGWEKLVAWVIWSACLVVTMYFQMSFFTSVSADAGESRAINSVQVISSNQQIETVKQALSRISARPVAEVARALSKSKDDKKIAALSAELDEAKRAEKLHDTLITLLSNADTIQSAESNDPVITLLEKVTHSNAATISITIGTASALVLEFLAAFCWYLLQSKPDQEVKPETLVPSGSTELTKSPVPEVPISSEDAKLTIVKQAVDTGEIQPTVESIRKLLKCSTAQAMALRKAFLSIPIHSPVARGEAKLDYIHPAQSEKSSTAAQLKKAA